MSVDRAWVNLSLCTMDGPADAPLGIIEDAAIAVAGDRIAWLGPRADLPPGAGETIDAGGAFLLPGLIDCHTHIVFGGDRADEWQQRLNGVPYERIALAGGGILSTMRATRAATEAALYDSALPRLHGLLAEGVTTIEIKSGYGLNLETELAQLRVARRIGATQPVSVVTSLLAAHAVPPEYTGRRTDYARHVAEAIVPAAAAAGLADAVDIFTDRIGFDVAETELVIAAAAAHHLPVKLHADQHYDFGAAALAARHGALSADHLEQTDAAGFAAMAAAGTVAVLLPGATYFLGMMQRPDIAAMRASGVRMALSTDMNPGSCPTRSLLLMLNLGCTLFRLTVEEALLGVTRNAAAALGLADRGVLRPGLRADFALYRISRPAELCYWLGGNPCVGRVVGGVG